MILFSFISGSAVMVYELVWSRWVMLGWGAGSGSFALTLASMMGGLAVGSELGGRLADKTPRPLRLFGITQLGTAAAALLGSLFLRSASGQALGAGLPTALYAAAASAAICLPAVLMGAGLPALASHLVRSGSAFDSGSGRLYSWNVLGAVSGTLATGFVLIERVGLWRSMWTGVCMNLAVAALSFAADRRSAKILEPPPAAAPAQEGGSALAALTAAAVSGFTVMAFEVLDTRLLVHGLLSTTHALTAILAAFLGGLALGARLCSARAKGPRILPGDVAAALMLSAGLSIALAPSLADSSVYMALLRRVSASWGAKAACESLLAVVLLLPATTAMGLVFPASIALHGSDGRPGAVFGRVSLVSSCTGILGAFGAAFVLIPLLGLRGAVAATALLQAACGLWLLESQKSESLRKRRLFRAAFCAVAVAGAVWARPPKLGGRPGEGTLVPQHVVGREQEYRVLSYREGMISTTGVFEHAATGRRDLVMDGFVMAGNAPGAGYMELMGDLPMTLHADPKRALVICFGTGATARAVARWPDAEISLVDIEKEVFASARHFDPGAGELLARARVFVEDGRRFLGRGGAAFTVITQEPIPPYFAGAAALYSLEYYRLARSRLSPDGVMVQWLPLHLVTPGDSRQIVATALAVFPETWVAIAPGDGTGLVVSSPKPLGPERIEEARSRWGVDFALTPEAARRYSAGAAPVTDDRPSLEYSGIDRVRRLYGDSIGLREHNLAQIAEARR